MYLLNIPNKCKYQEMEIILHLLSNASSLVYISHMLVVLGDNKGKRGWNGFLAPLGPYRGKILGC